MQHDFIMRSKMKVIKSKIGTTKSKIGRKFEQKRKAKWVKEKANLVKAYTSAVYVTGFAKRDLFPHLQTPKKCIPSKSNVGVLYRRH